MRSNTLSVLTQLSTYGHDSADPISMQTVRQVLELDTTETDPGIEGASNLFYYLFDDWRAVYITVAIFRQKLQVLVCIIHLENEAGRLTKHSEIRLSRTWWYVSNVLLTDNSDLYRRRNLLPPQISPLSHVYISSASKYARCTTCMKATRISSNVF